MASSTFFSRLIHGAKALGFRRGGGPQFDSVFFLFFFFLLPERVPPGGEEGRPSVPASEGSDQWAWRGQGGGERRHAEGGRDAVGALDARRGERDRAVEP